METEPASLELAKAWLLKADSDLRTAHKAAADPDPCLDTAIYHCQQAAEKALKGYLTLHGRKFPKTHDLGHLIDLAFEENSDFTVWRTIAESLTDYAVAYRYPDSIMAPEPEEYTQAPHDATALHGFVRSLIPE